MTTTEFYFLMFVLISFGSFAVALIIAPLQYKAWVKARAARPQSRSGKNGFSDKGLVWSSVLA